MEDTGYEDIDSEEIHERMVDINKWDNLPMDWDLDTDLLESFNPNYLEDKTFNRNDGLDLRLINVRKRVVEELTGAKVNSKTKGYAKELYENLTFDENSKSIPYKGEEIFVRNPENNNLELTIVNSQTLTEFKRLVGRVIVETDENRKVNEEEAKRIRLHLQKLWNLLTREGELEWDSVVDVFANTFNNTVMENETDPIGFSVRTQTENNELENVQLRREMAGAIKESINVNALLERVRDSPDIHDKDLMIMDKIQALTADATERDKRSKDERRNGRNDNAILFEQIRDLEIESANFLEVSYFNTDKPNENTENDITRYNRFKTYIQENFGTVAIFSSSVIAIAGLITGLIKSRDTIRTVASAAYNGSEFLMKLAKTLGKIAEPILKVLSKALGYIGDMLWWVQLS